MVVDREHLVDMVLLACWRCSWGAGSPTWIRQIALKLCRKGSGRQHGRDPCVQRMRGHPHADDWVSCTDVTR
jgi:hypothetical protein